MTRIAEPPPKVDMPALLVAVLIVGTALMVAVMLAASREGQFGGNNGEGVPINEEPHLPPVPVTEPWKTGPSALPNG